MAAPPVLLPRNDSGGEQPQRFNANENVATWPTTAVNGPLQCEACRKRQIRSFPAILPSIAPSIPQISNSQPTAIPNVVQQPDPPKPVWPTFLSDSIQISGMTTDLDTTLVNYAPHNERGETSLGYMNLRKTGPSNTYAKLVSIPASKSEASDGSPILDEASQAAINEYFLSYLQPSFPIVEEVNLLAATSDFPRGQALRAAVAAFSLRQMTAETAPITGLTSMQINQIRDSALIQFKSSLSEPTLSTIQCGLLLSQDPDILSPSLNSQLVVAGDTLGLSQDSTSWNITLAEKRLRKILAWTLYAQDKWTALTLGCPSLINPSNWTVPALKPDDFPTTPSSTIPADIQSHGSTIFIHYISLTLILSDILSSFFTHAAQSTLSSLPAHIRPQHTLSLAKPIQLALKTWFTSLPSPLKMDAPPPPNTPLSNAPLHLAYFATEITLHRCIVRSLSPQPLSSSSSSSSSTTTPTHPSSAPPLGTPAADPYLTHILRSAAKTRLISAMDFLNRLRPAHLLDTFWPFASSMSVALVGSFGTLLRVTSGSREEEAFYRCRGMEARWTLETGRKVGSGGASGGGGGGGGGGKDGGEEVGGKGVGERLFGYAVESLDAQGEVVGKYVPEKPGFVPPKRQQEQSGRDGEGVERRDHEGQIVQQQEEAEDGEDVEMLEGGGEGDVY
ncbi:MAG: hypothetical protein Q9227_003599 [Pyrenula ochraceoflavens]